LIVGDVGAVVALIWEAIGVFVEVRVVGVAVALEPAVLVENDVSDEALVFV
jgi:hypothetical protein